MQKDSKKDTYLNWHPNFRLSETLPDIKVVRTGFLVNFVAILAVLLALAVNGYREWRIAALGGEIETFQERLDAGQKQNSANLKLSGEFTRQSKVIEDVSTFYSLAYPPMDFLIAVTESRPDDIAFDSIRYTLEKPVIKKKGAKPKKADFVSKYTINGMLQGSSADALNSINRYRNTLSGLDAFKDRIVEIQVSQPRRNPALNLFEFQITLILKPQP
jgi:hypothetical protein